MDSLVLLIPIDRKAHGKGPFSRGVVRDLNSTLLSMESIIAGKQNPSSFCSKSLAHRLPQQILLLSILVHSLTARAGCLRKFSRSCRHQNKKPIKPIQMGEVTMQTSHMKATCSLHNIHTANNY